MSSGKFEWDDAKAANNVRKHGVTFEEAATVFDDPLGLIFEDELHSVGELREILIGHSARGRVLLVYFTERPDGVRIISSRAATRRECREYEENVTSRYVGD